MLTSCLLLASALLTLSAPPVDEGQGVAQEGTVLSGLNAGRHISGVPFDKSAMLGKVVVVEIGGS